MSLVLQLAIVRTQNKLQARRLTHLSVRSHDRNIIIYSIELDIEVYRAILSWFPSNDYIMSISNHRGDWQPIPFVGSLTEAMNLLVGNLAFALARWPNEVKELIVFNETRPY